MNFGCALPEPLVWSQESGTPRNMTGDAMMRSVVVLAFGIVLAGCSYTAGFFKPAPMSSTLQLESEPQGAEASSSLGGSCRTPCALPVTGTEDFTVTFALAGYVTQTVPVQFLPPADPRIDPNPRLDPNPVYAALPAAPAKKRPSARKKPRPKSPAASAQPTPAAGAVAASPFPPPGASPFPPPR